MDKRLQLALTDVCQLLDRREIRFALVGGIAASIRGRMRTTEDVDLVLYSEIEESVELGKDLADTTLRPMFPEFETVARTAFILALEHVPTGVTLDLAIGISGFERQIIERSQKLLLAGHEVPVATAEDLILMKLLAGRPQDDQDVRGIVEKQSNTLDWNYIASIASQLEEAVDIDLSVHVKRLRTNAPD